MKKHVIILIGLFLFLIAGCSQKNADQATSDNVVVNENNGVVNEVDNQGDIVEITSDGFNPNTLTIKSGETVTWVNEGSSQSWPASAVHPSHNVYPESGGCIGSKFDACSGLNQGETYSFTFNQKGAWKYHDHLSAGDTGTIIVQ